MRTGVLPDSNAIVTADYKRLVVNFSHCTLVADRRHKCTHERLAVHVSSLIFERQISVESGSYAVVERAMIGRART